MAWRLAKSSDPTAGQLTKMAEMTGRGTSKPPGARTRSGPYRPILRFRRGGRHVASRAGTMGKNSAISVGAVALGAVACIGFSSIMDGSSAMVGMASASSFRCSAKGSSATTPVKITGATANGSRDDFNAIQNAIDKAGRHGGGVVALPAGTFIINRHLVLKKNVKLTGVGPATVIKAGPHFMSTQEPGGGYSIITTAGAADTTIADLTADQSGNTLDGKVRGRLSGYVVEGRDSSNVVIDGVYIRNPFTYSIAMVRSTNFCVANSHTQVAITSGRYNQLDGIHILDSSSGEVINNFVQSGDDGLVAHTISASVHDVLYANNSVRGGSNADGMQLAVGNFPIYDITVEDNNFFGSRFGIRTGYYDNRTGSVSNISINRNYIHGLARGRKSPAIEIGGFGGLGPIKGVTIANNRTCDSGVITVSPGPGNVVTGTTGCPTANVAQPIRP